MDRRKVAVAVVGDRGGSGAASAGGARAAGGLRFQAEVFAWWSAHAVAGVGLGLGLDPAVRALAVGCETSLPVDDVGVTLCDGGFILTQAKRGLRRLDPRVRDLRAAVNQLVDAFLNGLRTRVEVRAVDEVRDRLLIATDAGSSEAFRALGTVLDRLRGHPESLPLADVARTDKEGTAWRSFQEVVRQSWIEVSGSTPTESELRGFYRVVAVHQFDFDPDIGVDRRRATVFLDQAGADHGAFSRLIDLGLTLARERSWRLRHQLTSELGIPAESSVGVPNRPRGHVSFEWLHQRVEEAVQDLGPRYNPVLTVDVPIRGVLAAFARRDAVLSPLLDLLSQAHAALCKAAVHTSWEVLRHLVAELADLRLAVESVDSGRVLPVKRWRERCDAVLKPVRDRAIAFPSMGRTRPQLADGLESCWAVLDGAIGWLDGPDPAAWNQDVLLVTGEQGRGKSHLLADTALAALDEGQPVVLLLGQHFLTTEDPWTQAVGNLQWPGTADEFLTAVNGLARAAGRRALLMVDALNEGEGLTIWPVKLAGFLRRVKQYQWIGVVLSVRTIAFDHCVPAEVAKNAQTVEHTGFAGVEFDAVREFFRHYKLVGPATPLLLPEFREPLFLELFCRTAQQRPDLLSRSAPGLSAVLEAFIATRDKVAAERLDTDPEDRVVAVACRELADAMLRHGKRWLDRREAKEITERVWRTSEGYSRSLFSALLAERVLINSFVRPRDGTTNAAPVQFAYERLADHLVATNLIASTYRDGRYDQDALALTVGGLRAGDTTFDALAMLLPERVGIELTDLAHPWPPGASKALSNRLIASLPLRGIDAITDTAATLLHERLFGDDRAAARTAAQVAVSLACRPGHRLDYRWLHTTLAGMPMWQRDMTWTVTAGTKWAPTPFSQLLTWIDAEDERIIAELAPEPARAVAMTLMWAFTSADRFLRDTATRRLVKLAAVHPSVLPALLHHAADVDDLYVLERVCAAVYGVALRGVPDMTLREIATAVLDTVFGHGGPPPHILIRDYVHSTVGLAHQRGLITETEQAQATGPWSSEWPGRTIPDEEALERLYPLFDDEETSRNESLWATIRLSAGSHGDFGRYIIGTNHPYSFPFTTELRSAPTTETDRSDTSTSNAPDRLAHADATAEPPPRRQQDLIDPELVCRFVILGVADRGWTPERFRDLDNDLGENESAGRGSHKRERIGKKYQWQAWHEALARLADTHLPSADTFDQPVTPTRSTSARDIDPSHQLTGNPNDVSTDEYSPDPPWWLPLPSPRGPDLSSFERQRTWIADRTQLIDSTGLVILPGAEAAGSPTGMVLGLSDADEWILLRGTVAWYWNAQGPAAGPSSDGVWADHGFVHHTVLIRQSDVPTVLARPPGPYKPYEYRQDFTDGAFLGEFPDQPAFTDVLADRELEDGWTSETAIASPVLITTDRYVWEGSIYDCSLTNTVSVTLPSAHLLQLLAPNARPRDGAIYTADGTVIAFAPNVHEPGNSALLIRADLLHTKLTEAGLTLGRVIYQERRSGEAHKHNPWPGMTTRTSLHVHTPTPKGWTTAGTTHHEHDYPPRHPREDNTPADTANPAASPSQSSSAPNSKPS